MNSVGMYLYMCTFQAAQRDKQLTITMGTSDSTVPFD